MDPFPFNHANQVTHCASPFYASAHPLDGLKALCFQVVHPSMCMRRHSPTGLPLNSSFHLWSDSRGKGVFPLTLQCYYCYSVVNKINVTASTNVIMWYLLIKDDLVIVFHLPANEFLDHRKQLRRHCLEVLVEVPLDGKAGKDVVVDQRRP